MMTVDLQPTPTQRLQFNSDGQQYDIRIFYDGQDMMFMDVSLNGIPVAYSCPCLVSQQIVPYDYLEGDGGNFFFATADGGNPIWSNFGGTDILLYGTNAEIAAQRAINAASISQLTLSAHQTM